jgi:hypothetical protein
VNNHRAQRGEICLAKKQGRKKEDRREMALPGFDVPQWGRWLILTGILMLAMGIVYQGAFTDGLVFQSADASNSQAFTQVGDAGLAQGQYPLWNPYLFAGMPSFGSTSYLKYIYPPATIFNTLQDWGLPPLTWMFGHLLFGGLGMAWLLSRWKLPFGALVLGAVIWLLFPKVVAWGVHGHGSKLGAAMYLPWIVASVWRVLDGKGWRSVGLTALFLGLLLLRSHPQITYYTLALVAWLALWNGFWPLDATAGSLAASVRWKRIGQVGIGLAVGFLVGAVLLVPVHDYAGFSIRGQDTAGGGGVGLDYATGWSLAPSEYGTTVFPLAAGFGKATYLGHMPFNDYPNYFGFLILALVATAWAARYRSMVSALLVMSLLSVFVSFGNFGFGFYEWLYGWLPFFNKFRVPSMILILPAFAAAILAPIGATRLAEGQLKGKIQTIYPALLGGVGFLLLMGSLTGMAEGFFKADLKSLALSAGKTAPDVLLNEAWNLHQGSLMLIGLVLLTAAAAIWGRSRSQILGSGRLIWVLVILVLVDLSAVDKLIVGPEKGLQVVVQDPQGRARLAPAGKLMRPFHKTRIEQGPAASTLKTLVGHDRVFPLGSYGGSNLWMGDGVRSLDGYHAAKLATYEQIRKRLTSDPPAGRIASWLAGRIVAFDVEFSDAQLQVLASLGAQLDPVPLSNTQPVFYRNLSAVPRARLLTNWELVSTLPEKDALEPFLDGVQSGQIDVFNTVFLTKEPAVLPGSSDQPLPEPVFIKDGFNEIILEFNSPVSALLLLSDMMAPGWTARVDGQSVPVMTADLVLRAVAVEAGKHTVHFQYSDPGVKRGLTLSIAGGILTLIMLLLPTLVRRRTQAPEGSPEE